MGVFATGGRTVSEPYYSQSARSVCVSLIAIFIFVLFLFFNYHNTDRLSDVTFCETVVAQMHHSSHKLRLFALVSLLLAIFVKILIK